MKTWLPSVAPLPFFNFTGAWISKSGSFRSHTYSWLWCPRGCHPREAGAVTRERRNEERRFDPCGCQGPRGWASGGDEAGVGNRTIVNQEGSETHKGGGTVRRRWVRERGRQRCIYGWRETERESETNTKMCTQMCAHSMDLQVETPSKRGGDSPSDRWWQWDINKRQYHLYRDWERQPTLRQWEVHTKIEGDRSSVGSQRDSIF
jgi:hypothetical protein